MPSRARNRTSCGQSTRRNSKQRPGVLQLGKILVSCSSARFGACENSRSVSVHGQRPFVSFSLVVRVLGSIEVAFWHPTHFRLTPDSRSTHARLTRGSRFIRQNAGRPLPWKGCAKSTCPDPAPLFEDEGICEPVHAAAHHVRRSISLSEMAPLRMCCDERNPPPKNTQYHGTIPPTGLD